MNWKIPFNDLVLGKEEKDAVLSVIESNWLTMGPKTSEFEAAFSLQMSDKEVHAVAVTNGTAALHLALAALGIGPGDEVICPSLTFVATANAIRYTGATPVFSDISSEEEWNIDPDDIERRVTENTKAVLVVHYAGYPCQMDKIIRITSAHKLKVIEDVSHGPLAEWKGRKLGTIGDVGCFSFFSNKNMTTGEGGMVITKASELSNIVRQMRSHGMTSTTYDRFKGHASGYDVTKIGFNYRIDEIRAAIGIEQLKKLPSNNFLRKQRIDRYRWAIRSELPEITIPFSSCSGNYGYHIFPILLPNGYKWRQRLMDRLSDRGIQTSIHYRPIHDFTEFRKHPASLPITEAVAPRILSLPLYPHIKDDQIDHVVSTLKTCLT